jgi:hypothetical protein
LHLRLTAFASTLFSLAIFPLSASPAFKLDRHLPVTGITQFTDSNLPIVFIDTQGKTIQNSYRIHVLMGVIDNGAGKRNFITDPFNNYYGYANIEIRGSSGQWQKWPKIQYGFETQDSSGVNLNVPLLGLPAENDWILYPPYSDKSLLRNVLVYGLANDMGQYASRTRFCEVVLNGDYRGIYVLLEKIKRDKNRVNISEITTQDISDDAKTGGYIIKVDRAAGEENGGWTSSYDVSPTSSNRITYLYHYPKPLDLTSLCKSYIQNFIYEFETLMRNSGWEQKYEQYLNIDAFIDYYLMNELTRNVDAWSLSTFMYKDRDDKGGRLTLGPLWDYNLGFGNVNYYTGEVIEGWMLERKLILNDKIPCWLRPLFYNPSIQSMIKNRWQSLRKYILNFDRIVAIIDGYVTFLHEAQVRNFQRWPILGQYVWPNNYVGQSYQDEIDYLKDWIEKRGEWMDNQLSSSIAVDGNTVIGEQALLGQNYPNPFNHQTIVPYEVSGAGRVSLEIINIIGQTESVFNTEVAAAGHYSFTIDGARLPSGLYLYVLKFDDAMKSGFMVVQK